LHATVVVEAVYLAFVIGNLVLTIAFKFQPFKLHRFSVSPFVPWSCGQWSVVALPLSAFPISASRYGPPAFRL
jgi:hypothetical protein